LLGTYETFKRKTDNTKELKMSKHKFKWTIVQPEKEARGGGVLSLGKGPTERGGGVGL